MAEEHPGEQQQLAGLKEEQPQDADEHRRS